MYCSSTKNRHLLFQKHLQFTVWFDTLYEQWGCSSLGRALHWQCRGSQFDPGQLHQLYWSPFVMFTDGFFLSDSQAIKENSVPVSRISRKWNKKDCETLWSALCQMDTLNKYEIVDPFSIALKMERTWKSHKRKPMAIIRLVCPYRCIVSLKIDTLIKGNSFQELNFPLFLQSIISILKYTV